MFIDELDPENAEVVPLVQVRVHTRSEASVALLAEHCSLLVACSEEQATSSEPWAASSAQRVACSQQPHSLPSCGQIDRRLHSFSVVLPFDVCVE